MVNWFAVGLAVFAIVVVGVAVYFGIFRDNSGGGDPPIPPPCTISNLGQCTTVEELDAVIQSLCLPDKPESFAQQCNDACVQWYDLVNDDGNNICEYLDENDNQDQTAEICQSFVLKCRDCTLSNWAISCTFAAQYALITNETICSDQQLPADQNSCDAICGNLQAGKVLGRCDEVDGYNYCAINAVETCVMASLTDFTESLDECEEYNCTRLCRDLADHVDVNEEPIDACDQSICIEKSATCCLNPPECPPEALYWLQAEECG